MHNQSIKRDALKRAPYVKGWASAMHARTLLSVMLIFLGGAVSTASTAEEIIGMWSATARSKGGLGSQWVLAQDGKATLVFGALVSFRYELTGNRIKMTLLESGRPTAEVSEEEFVIANDVLTVNPRHMDRKQIMKRVGKPIPGVHPIVGEWTYIHYTGGPAYMRYSRSGLVELSVPMKSINGKYEVQGESLSISLEGQAPMVSRFHFGHSTLTMKNQAGRASTYMRFAY